MTEKKNYYVKHYHTLPPPYGGVSVYVKRLMLAFCKQGLISGAFKGKEIVGLPKSVWNYLDEFPKHARSIFILPEIFKLYRIFRPYRIIHAHTTLTTCLGIWLIHVLQNKPVVYTIHNQMIDREFSLLYFWDKLILRLLAQSPSVQFTTVNRIAKERIEAKGYYFKNEIKVISPYVPPIEFGQPSDYISEELLKFIEKNKRFILFYAESFATYQEEDVYGTRTIIDAFIKLSRHDDKTSLLFCIANIGGSQGNIKSLMDKIEKSGCSGRVYWQIGAIHEMWPLLKKAALLVRPTTTDGDSVMIREALSFGLPVVTSDVTHRPQGCIVYPVNNLSALVKKMQYIIENPYRKVFSQEDQTQNMLEIYRSLLDKMD